MSAVMYNALKHVRLETSRRKDREFDAKMRAKDQKHAEEMRAKDAEARKDKLAMAKEFLAIGAPLSEIVRITGLSAEEIKE